MAEQSRARNITAWVISALLFVLYAALSGPGKVMGQAEMVENFSRWGHSDAFRVFIGACEIAGGIGLLIPMLATWAAAGLVIIMSGAVYTHAVYGEPFYVPLIAAVLLVAVALLRRQKALFLSGAKAPPAPDPAS
jgi:uncharacterized membrane protein YphA (DoxX/SURF4 family)